MKLGNYDFSARALTEAVTPQPGSFLGAVGRGLLGLVRGAAWLGDVVTQDEDEEQVPDWEYDPMHDEMVRRNPRGLYKDEYM